jgi:hypothetical protein
MEATLNIRLVYSGSDAQADTIKAVLQSLVETAADRGMLTSDLDLVVEESDFDIKVEG